MCAAVTQQSSYFSVYDAVKALNIEEPGNRRGDLRQFIRALANGADVNLRLRSTGYSVFEHACKSPGRKQFIEECIKRGALVAEENPKHKVYPIHLAALSFDSDNLSQLLDTQQIIVDQKYDNCTALYLLFEQIDSKNWIKVFSCIKLLLTYHANINATDQFDVSPIALLVTPGNDVWRKEILEYCLQNYTVNVDFRRKQARKAIEKHFPGTSIPDIDMEKVTVEVLRNKLTAGTEDDFLVAYEKYIAEGHVLREEECAEFLSVAVYRSKLTTAQKLIEGQIVDGKYVGKPALLSGLLAKCCNRGNVPMLEWLLKIIPAHEVALINEDPLLSLLVKQIDVYNDKEKCSFFASMKILLNDPRIEIDKKDEIRCTAMQYAVKYRIDHAQELLLAKGAYIGGEDLFGKSPISEMDSFLLEKHLNSCVTENDRKPGDEDYEVRIDFSNFIPPNRTYQANYADVEMRPIMKIAQTASKKQLLWHPVISSILLLKWIQLTRMFYINLLFSVIFAFSFTTYIVFYLGQGNTTVERLYYSLSIVGLMCLTSRELIQFWLNMRVYVRSLENVMEVLLIIASGAVLVCRSSNPVVLVGIILLLGLELTLQISMVPVDSISIYLVMLKTVAKNFLKCLAVCSILLLAFAFSFYTVFRIAHINRLNETKDNSTIHLTADDDERFNQFQELPLALIKTAVMLTGEFEAANIHFQLSWIVYLLFPLFVFFVAIVMNNLMNGVAVSDTASIQAESESIGITKMVFVICRHENTIKALNSNRVMSKLLSWLIPSNSLQLFHKNEPLIAIILQRFKSHTIECETFLSLENRSIANVENGLAQYELVNSTDSPRRYYTYDINHFYYNPFDRMRDKIMKSSMQILHSRQLNIGSIAYHLSQLEQLLSIAPRSR